MTLNDHASPALRVAVVTEASLASTKAHAINVVKTAGGFERLGHNVTLYAAPLGSHDTISELLQRYGEPNLSVVAADADIFQSCRTDDERSRAIGHWAAQRAHADGVDVVYARHFWGALASADLGLPTIMETHAYVGDPRPILNACFAATARRGNPLQAISTISPVLRDHYVQRGARATKVAVIPDGVDLHMFAPPPCPGASPFANHPGPHAVYCGHLYDYKGIPTILNAAATCPDITWHLVGGDASDIQRTRNEVEARRLHNVVIHGHKPYMNVPTYMWHADVLLLPPEADHPSANWTSPVKLGEYLASGRPIVASDIPGLKSWASEPAVRWFRASDPADLVRNVQASVTMTLSDHLMQRMAASRLAERFSYMHRARRMLSLAGVHSLQLAA